MLCFPYGLATAFLAICLAGGIVMELADAKSGWFCKDYILESMGS